MATCPWRGRFTPSLPLSLEGDESVATTDDARAMLFNPAATGARYPAELFEGFARYDANLGPHHHFLCTACGAVHDVPFDALPPLPNVTCAPERPTVCAPAETHASTSTQTSFFMRTCL